MKAEALSRRRMTYAKFVYLHCEGPRKICRIRTHHLKRSRSTSRWKTRCGVRETTVIAKTKQYLEESKSVKMDTDVDFMKKAARYLRPSAQMVRVSSWWSVVRDGTSTEGG